MIKYKINFNEYNHIMKVKHIIQTVYKYFYFQIYEKILIIAKLFIFINQV